MITYYCSKCGSTDLLCEIAFMQELNTNEYLMPSIGETYETDYYYCNDCEDECQITESKPETKTPYNEEY